MRSGFGSNDFKFAGFLNACADYVAEDLRKQVRGYITQKVSLTRLEL
jgi:hypothetical protein